MWVRFDQKLVFWLGTFRFGYVSVGYVLVLYILTETIYKLKVHDF